MFVCGTGLRVVRHGRRYARAHDAVRLPVCGQGLRDEGRGLLLALRRAPPAKQLRERWPTISTNTSKKPEQPQRVELQPAQGGISPVPPDPLQTQLPGPL